MAWTSLIKIDERITSLRPTRALNSTLSISNSKLEESFPLETSMGVSSMMFKGVGCLEAEKYVISGFTSTLFRIK